MMRALRLKIEPAKDQSAELDSMFWRWASICTRVSYGKSVIQELDPRKNDARFNFSRTQLHMANTQVADLSKALKASAGKIAQRITRLEEGLADINEALGKDECREKDPKNPDKFTIKKWVQRARRLKNKFYSMGYWERKAKEQSSKLRRTEQTLRKVESGRMTFKPTQIRIWDTLFQMNLAENKIMLKLHDKKEAMQLEIIATPIQKPTGSSMKSRIYMQEGLRNFIVYTLDHSLLGLGRAKMLLNAKKPEAIAKKEAMLRQKVQSEGEKIHEMEKMIGRQFSDEERKTLALEFRAYYESVATYQPSREYVAKMKTLSAVKGIVTNKLGYKPSNPYSLLIGQLADELLKRSHYFCPNKYIMIIRKPVNRYKAKKLSALEPDEWEYFLQLSYEQLSIEKIEPEAIMGINRGIVDLFALVVIDKKGNQLASRLIANRAYGWKRYRRQLLDSIQNLERSSRASKDFHIKENQLKKKLRRTENRVKSEYHLISSEIVKLAERYKAVIVFENIEKSAIKQHGRSRAERLKKLNYVLSNFNYADMAQKVAQKAAKRWIPVRAASAGYISSNCYKCLLESGSDAAEANYHRYEQNRRNSRIGYCKEHTTNLEEAKAGNAECCEKWMKLTFKTGHCLRHGFIDADINAARVVAYLQLKGQSSVFA